MRLGLRIVLFVAIVAIFPLGLLALAATKVARDQVEDAILRGQIAQAESVAATAARRLDDVARVLRLQVANFRLDTAPPEARGAFLLATWRLFPEIGVAFLLDGQGAPLAPAVYAPEGTVDDALGHERLSEARVAAFREALVARPAAGEVDIGAAYVPPGGGPGVIPVVVTSPWGDGVTLAAELSLGAVATESATREVVLLDAQGGVLLRVGQAGLVEPARFRALLASPSAGVRYVDALGSDVLAATARVPGREWVVVVAEPADAAVAGVRRIQARTGYIGGFAILFATVAGLLLTRSITGPVTRLRDAAQAVGRGELETRVTSGGRDELAELAAAFNQMTASIQHGNEVIAAKNVEIEAWNVELQERVDARTRELREAQARLVQSGQLAAVAEMSAGLAHELNNPLAGILGLVQVAGAQLAGRPEEGLLRAAEREALRCRDIVANLLRMARTAGEPPQRDVVELRTVVQDVLALVGGPLRARGVTVDWAPGGSPLRVRGDAASLGRALGQLLTSMRSVARMGTTLQITGNRRGPDVELRFELGATVSETDDWEAAGMGFWVARQVLQEHDATLEDPTSDRTLEGTPAPGGPRTWRLRIPADAS